MSLLFLSEKYDLDEKILMQHHHEGLFSGSIFLQSTRIDSNQLLS